ncbi:hypothetical protein GGS21DRAFT_530169 [Xylaria nigripes]|nr:hypothetical protein GGS21DRAFT_530169 [Xylaria nigripes]
MDRNDPIEVTMAIYKVLDERDPNHWAIYFSNGAESVILQIGDDKNGVGYYVEDPIRNKEPARSARLEESIVAGTIDDPNNFEIAVNVIQATPTNNTSTTWNCQAWAMEALDRLRAEGLFRWDLVGKAKLMGRRQYKQ